MSHFIKHIFIVLLLNGLLIGCVAPAATAIPTVALTATIVPTVPPAPTLQPGDSERTLTVDGQERTYLLHIPPGLDKGHPVSVVLIFHELEASAEDASLLTHFDDIADKNGFIVGYPNGLGGSWNAGGCCRYAVEKNIDEIAFVRQILSDLGTIASLDPKRVYAAGFSNGGMLSYRLACEMSDTFAAIASVSGDLFYNPCQPQQSVSVIQVHGLADTIVPYNGGKGTYLPNVIFPPVEQGITTWVQLDGCTGSPQVEKQDIITHTVYSSCNAGAAVELYAIEVGRHEWPSKYVWPASQAIWDFFAAHPKP
jgi:polyhydroxybutyrate depolymerase